MYNRGEGWDGVGRSGHSVLRAAFPLVLGSPARELNCGTHVHSLRGNQPSVDATVKG